MLTLALHSSVDTPPALTQLLPHVDTHPAARSPPAAVRAALSSGCWGGGGLLGRARAGSEELRWQAFLLAGLELLEPWAAAGDCSLLLPTLLLPALASVKSVDSCCSCC